MGNEKIDSMIIQSTVIWIGNSVDNYLFRQPAATLQMKVARSNIIGIYRIVVNCQIEEIALFLLAYYCV
jgi:hypothetical protein